MDKLPFALFSPLNYSKEMFRAKPAAARAGVKFVLISKLFLASLNLFFAACGSGPAVPVPVSLSGGVSFAAERGWLENILASSAEIEAMGLAFSAAEDQAGPPKDGAVPADTAGITIDFYESWEDGGEGVIVSKTWLVPREDPLKGRFNTSLDLCMEGKEDLVPVDEIAAPFAALRVNGLSAGDEAYPLIRYAGIKLRVNAGGKSGALNLKAAALEEFLRSLPKPLVKEKPELFWISAAGDLMLGRGAGSILLRDGAPSLFGGAAEILLSSDLALVNLEGPLGVRGAPAQKTYTFRFEPPAPLAAAIKASGIDAVLFANNHAFDYGREAFLESLSFLEESGIAVLGAGRSEEKALRPALFSKGNSGARIWGLASFPAERSGWNGLEHTAAQNKAGYLHASRGGGEALENVLKAGKDASEKTIDIIMLHGGEEWTKRPGPALRELSGKLTGAGADLVICSHPHIVQGFEWLDKKLVFWSLGNFVFSGMENTGGGDEGLMIRLGYLDTKPLYIEAFALSLYGPRVNIAPEEKLEDFYRKSRELARGGVK